MAKTAAQRRAARKRKEQERAGRRPAQAAQAADQPELLWTQHVSAAQNTERRVARLLAQGAEAPDEEGLTRVCADLAALDPEVDSHGHLTRLLMTLLDSLWEHGWQPADVAHVVRRQGRPRMTRLALAAIARQAQLADVASLAPEEWRAQLLGLELPDDPPAALISAWGRGERLAAADAWAEALRLLRLLAGRGELPRLCPPPSQWRHVAGRRTAPKVRSGAHHADPRVLGRIRGLLAKAEGTDYPEEADALTAKAQELMTRYAVDEAVLDAERGGSLTDEVSSRRVHLENPYPEAKLRLLDAVGSANGVRVIYLESLGIATVVGLPVDLDLIDVLFTSLLVQATRALGAAGRAGGPGTRAPSFRRSFLISYAARIRERLEEARSEATQAAESSRGAALVPIMRERREAVDEVFDELFPTTHAITTRAWNARGWHAGRLAADAADLGSGRDAVPQ
ncbi:DUF2786 domain-containing protein [Blastococcus saxobsidens]|uniref:Uncharacterized protein n=1 Tax=Blastococcus saxobsidens (strain DD2) TaxID=1146883 RepID=H6RTD5_BLASD|nr:DUF2786 domain-containing protein [Blastococcus saxobsidens]CCG05635.1 conserved protein of unknown function,putative coiled-coil domain [Blastococcus saxobsidens DD2]